jgi:hypothetical protein
MQSPLFTELYNHIREPGDQDSQISVLEIVFQIMLE